MLSLSEEVFQDQSHPPNFPKILSNQDTKRSNNLFKKKNNHTDHTKRQPILGACELPFLLKTTLSITEPLTTQQLATWGTHKALWDRRVSQHPSFIKKGSPQISKLLTSTWTEVRKMLSLGGYLTSTQRMEEPLCKHLLQSLYGTHRHMLRIPGQGRRCRKKTSGKE